MKYPIRVLHVLGALNRGGAETMVMNLYRNIDRSKVQFDFIVHTKDRCDYDDEIKFLGGKIYNIPRYKGKNHLQYKKSWNIFLKEHPEYKIIHGHVRSTASIYLKIAKQYGLSTIAHSHSTSSGKGISAIVKNILQYPIRNTADYLFACSKSAGEWLYGKKTCMSNKFFILKNAIDTKNFIFNNEIRLNKRREFHIEDKFVVGHIGRFHPLKNHGFLIDVFKEVYDKNKNSILLLVGDGELRQSIERKVSDLGLGNNVIFTGVRSDISGLLQAMDVFAFPSFNEGLGIVAIEAQATGLQCIVSDAIPEMAIVSKLVQRKSFKEGIKGWADYILQYKDGYERNDTSKTIINSGYDIKSTTQWVEKFYLDLL